MHEVAVFSHRTYIIGVTFLEIQNAVMSDRFGENRRASVKQWINYRMGRVWASEPWTFKIKNDTLTLPSGSNNVDLEDFQRVFSVYDASSGSNYHTVVNGMRPEDFYHWATSSSGIPDSFTVYNGVLYADRVASSDRLLRLIGEQKWELLVTDDAVPTIPEEFHYMLVPAAISEGLRRENDPSWQAEEASFQAAIVDMKQAYLTEVRTYGDTAPAWP